MESKLSVDNVQRLLIFFGLTGSGKSYLASRWAEKNGFAYFNSDVIRKQLVGIVPTQQCRDGINSGIYHPEYSKKTYEEMLNCALGALEDGHPIAILDASFHLQNQRQRVIDTFSRDYQVLFIYCFCSENVTLQRLKKRLAEPDAVSDGRLEVYLDQLKKFEYPVEIPNELLLELDTDASVEHLIARLEDFVTSAPSADRKDASPNQ